MKYLYPIFLWLLVTSWACSSDSTSTDDKEPPETQTDSSEKSDEGTTSTAPVSTAPNAVALNVDELLPFREGFAIVKKGESQALINAKGDTVIPFNKYIFGAFQGEYRDKNCRYVTAYNRTIGYLNGLCPVGVKAKDQRGYAQTLWGCLDLNQKLVIPAEYQGNFQLVGEYLITHTQVQGTMVCLNRQGQQVKYPGCLLGQEIHQPRLARDVSMDSYSISPAEQRIIIHMYKGRETKYGLADFDGTVIAEPAYEQIKSFSEGLAPVMKKDVYGQPKWGYLDASGKVAIDFKFSNEPGAFHCGLALVIPKDNSQFNYAYINTQGETVIQEKEATASVGDEQYEFKGGYVMTNTNFVLDTKGTKYGFMRIAGSYRDPQTGQTIASLPYENYIRLRPDRYETFNPRQFVFSYSNRFGMTSLKANLMLPPVFSQLSQFDPESRLAYAVYANPNGEEQREGYINTKGVFVIVKGKGGTW
ncbi:hypothetical protein GCM10028808_39610 [Spirosoma migulaei]